MSFGPKALSLHGPERRIGKKPKVKSDNIKRASCFREKKISIIVTSRQLGVRNITFMKWEKDGLNIPYKFMNITR